jgi:peptidyl-prolyl cis-trans isomerase SurA
MKLRFWAITVGWVCGIAAPMALAQTPQPVDYIVAVVNSEPIVNSEVRSEVQRTLQQLNQQRQPVPPADELRKSVLERIINERVQLQQAAETGLRVDEATVNQTEQNIATQNKMDVAELRRRVVKEGTSVLAFRTQLRDQLLLSRLHERDVAGRIRISDAEVERALLEQRALSADPFAQEINLAQILIAVPENPTEAQVTAAESQAKKILERARAGEDFAKLVSEFSAGDKANGGALGLRKGDRYPPTFALAVQQIEVGSIAAVVRSGAGFHVLKVLEKRNPVAVPDNVVETHARHILLRPGTQVAQEAAFARLSEIRERILAGKGDFAAIAKEASLDGSAPQGGDLGWARPGMFVSEFEQAMTRLADGEISPPVVSRFGMHLIQVQERRRVALDPKEIRELKRNQLKDGKYEETFTNWAKDLRDKAFVEMREPPQ